MSKPPSPTPPLGYVREAPGLTAASQMATLRAHGHADASIAVDGGHRASGIVRDWAWLLAKLRSGDVLSVVALRVIYVSGRDRTPRRSLMAAVHNVEDRGASIVETSTGRSSTNQRERDMMIVDALDRIARTGRGGRPRFGLPGDQHAYALEQWTSTRHRTNADAFAAIVTTARARGWRELLRLRSVQAFGNVFGGSGRPRQKLPMKGKKP